MCPGVSFAVCTEIESCDASSTGKCVSCVRSSSTSTSLAKPGAGFFASCSTNNFCAVTGRSHMSPERSGGVEGGYAAHAQLEIRRGSTPWGRQEQPLPDSCGLFARHVRQCHAGLVSGPLLSGFIPINKENEMFGRSSLMGAALLAGLANAGAAQPYERSAPSRSRGPALAPGSSMMMFGINKGRGGSVASDKRASAKRRNQQRNKAAPRG